MHRIRFATIPALMACLVSPWVWAEERPPENNWSDEAELSYVQTGGNSNVKTLSAKNLLKVEFTDRITGSWKLAVLRGEAAGVLTAERYLSEWRGDYAITDRRYAFVTVGWAKDEFSGIDASTSIGPGAGYKFLTGPVHLLIGEAGLVYVAERYTNNTESERVDGRLFGSYVLAFSGKNKFTQTVEYLHDFDESDNYRFNSETALVTALASVFSIKISYTLRYDHQPIPATLTETDTVLAVALLASFRRACLWPQSRYASEPAVMKQQLMLRRRTHALHFDAREAGAGDVDAIAAGERQIECVGQHHADDPGMTDNEHSLAGLFSEQSIPASTYPRREIHQWLRTRRALIHRIAFETLDHLRIHGAQLLGGFTFPFAESHFFKTRLGTQGQAMSLRQFSRKRQAA